MKSYLGKTLVGSYAKSVQDSCFVLIDSRGTRVQYDPCLSVSSGARKVCVCVILATTDSAPIKTYLQVVVCSP